LIAKGKKREGLRHSGGKKGESKKLVAGMGEDRRG